MSLRKRGCQLSNNGRDQILELMRSQNWSNKTLAKLAGVHSSTVTRWLYQGLKIDQEKAYQIAKALNLSLTDIVSVCEEEAYSISVEARPTSQRSSNPLGSSFKPPKCSGSFYRQSKLQEIQKATEESSVVLLSGHPGVGKSIIAAQLAEKLGNDYQVFWLEKEGLLILEELLEQINDFLNENGEYGFVTTHGKQKEAGIKIPVNSKIATLVRVIGESKSKKYAFFIDVSHCCPLADESEIKEIQPLKEIQPFIDKFSLYGGSSLVFLIDRCPSGNSLPPSIAKRVKQISVEGFGDEEVTEYLNQRSKDYGVEWLPEDASKIIEKTGGYPLALDLIIYGRSRGVPLKEVLDRLVEDDKLFGGGELHKKLLEDVAQYLDDEEKEALRRLSLFRTPVKRSAWKYLDIRVDIGEFLLQSRWLTPVGYEKFQMAPLLRLLWKQEASQTCQEISQWHQKAANYYFKEETRSNLNALGRIAYLEAYYHFQKIGLVEEAAQVINDLVRHIHEQERLPSERLPTLNTWLLELEDTVFADKPWLLLEKGRKLDKNGSLEEAESVFQKAYEVFDLAGDQLGASVALYYVAKMLCLQKQPQLALQRLHSILEMPKVKADSLMQLRILGKMIDCYNDIGHYQDAQIAANKAEELAIMSGDMLGRALVLYDKGSIERRLGHYSDAEKLFSESAKKFEELGDIYRQSKALSRLGIVQNYQSKFEQAIANSKAAIKLKEKIEDIQGKARDVDYLADIYSNLGIYDKAEKRYKESLEIKKGGGDLAEDLYGQIKAYNNLAKVALATGRLSDVDNYLQESEKLINDQNEQPINLRGVYLRLLGDLQFAKGDYEAALENYRESSECFKPPHREVPNSYAMALFSLGKTYLAIRSISLSKHYLEASFAVFENSSMPYHKALALTYLGRLKSLVGHIEEAKIDNQNAIKIAENITSENILSVCLETQGIIEENQILHNFNYEALKEDERKEITKSLINQVWETYTNAIQRLIERQRQLTLDEAKLKVKKYLWWLTVKQLCREPISADDAYDVLIKEPFASHFIYIELLAIKYTLCKRNELSNSLTYTLSDLTLSILSPLAMRFGFNLLREEIEDLAVGILHPSEYQEIAFILEKRFPNREEFIRQIKFELQHRLNSANIQAEIQVRAKTIPSIYKKQIARKVTLDKILDLVGIRIITQTVDECYTTLAVVQNMGEFFQGKGILREPFRDFIQKPKQTGYRSLHINIEYGKPEPRIVEFQIRTHEMHLAAEFGFSIFGLDQLAHWHYKDSSVYAQPSRARIYDRGHRKRPINFTIECEPSSVPFIGEVLLNSKDIEISNVDIDGVQTNDSDVEAENRIIVQFKLGAKKQVRDEQEHLGKLLSKIVLELKRFMLKEKLNCYFQIEFEQSMAGTVANLLGSLRLLSSKPEEELEIQGLDIVDTKAAENSSTKPSFMRLKIGKKNLTPNLQQKEELNKFIDIFQIKYPNFWTLVIDDTERNSEIQLAKFSPEEKARLLHNLTSYSSSSNNFIYIFTPRGDIKKLPTKATTIDFAYQIHTDIGNQCVGAKVNGKMSPLETVLNNGDIVEIITHKNSHPSLDWLKFVENPSTRKRIEQGYRRSRLQENIDIGRKRLEKELVKSQFECLLKKNGFESLLKSESMQLVALRFNYNSVEDLLAAIGYGEKKPLVVVNRLREVKAEYGRELLKKELSKNGSEALQKLQYMQEVTKLYNYHSEVDLLVALAIEEITVEWVVKCLQEQADQSHQSLKVNSDAKADFEGPKIDGIKRLVHHMAGCCNPVPYDACVGVVKDRGLGVFIHREDCANLDRVSGNRRVSVTWPVDIQIEVVDKQGVLREIVCYLDNFKINIRKQNVDTSPEKPDVVVDTPTDQTTVIDQCIDIRDRKQLRRIIEEIRKIKNVLDVRCLTQVGDL